MEWEQDLSVRHYRITSNVGGYIFLAAQARVNGGGYEFNISPRKSFAKKGWHGDFLTMRDAQNHCVISAIEKVSEIEKEIFQEVKVILL